MRDIITDINEHPLGTACAVLTCLLMVLATL